MTQKFWASTSLKYVFKKIKGVFAKWPLSTAIVVQFWTSLVQSRTWNWIKQNLKLSTFEYFSFNKLWRLHWFSNGNTSPYLQLLVVFFATLWLFRLFFPMSLLYKESLSLTSVAWWLYLPLLVVEFVQQNGKFK
jgi:hypothetical protein